VLVICGSGDYRTTYSSSSTMTRLRSELQNALDSSASISCRPPLKPKQPSKQLVLWSLSPNDKRSGCVTTHQHLTSKSTIHGAIRPTSFLFITWCLTKQKNSTAPSGPRPPHYRGFTITLRHTTLGRTPLGEWSARRRDLYLTTHYNHKKQTSMSPAGFQTTNPASGRAQTHALDRAATGIR
jgi:hypothetical protein